MSATQDQLDALNARLVEVQQTTSTAADGIRSDIGDLKAQIEDLKTQVANGQPVDLSAIEATAESLEAGASALAGLDAENPAAEPPSA